MPVTLMFISSHYFLQLIPIAFAILTFIGILFCVRKRHEHFVAIPGAILLGLLFLASEILLMFIKNGLLTALISIILFASICIFFCYRAKTTFHHFMEFSIGLLVIIILCMVAMLFVKNGFLTLLILIMFLACIGMIICSRLKNTLPHAKALAIGLTVVILLNLLIVFLISFVFVEEKTLWVNEMKYSNAATLILGQRLADKYPGTQVLIISSPKHKQSYLHEALLDGLEQGFGNKISIKAINHSESVSDEENKNIPNSKSYFSYKDFDNVIKENLDCDMVISLVGLPIGYRKMSIWKPEFKNRPQIVLVYTAESYAVSKLKQPIAQGYFSVLTFRPGAKVKDEPCPENPQKAFEERFLIIDKDNVEEMDKTHGNLFR